MNGDAPDNFDERLAERSARLQSNNNNNTTTTNTTHKLTLSNVKPAYTHQGSLPNTLCTVSTLSALLGAGFAFSLATLLLGTREWWHLSFFFASWCFFHWAEFAVTAGWNEEKCSVDSFLLENGSLYHIAHAVAITEYIITVYFYPSLKTHTNVAFAGIVLVAVGQILRSAAMIHASTNFSHSVAFYKVEGHRLVTDGIYRWFRHPSYAGFYYWALGTQIVLLNPVAFTLYAILMWKFFSRRIKAEESALMRFFGEEYVRYRAKVGTKIPLIG